MTMICVRFSQDMHAAISRFARQDRKTVSRWLRDLVAREMKNPQRSPAVDFSAYPQSQTVASGAPLDLAWISVQPPSGTSTGNWYGAG